MPKQEKPKTVDDLPDPNGAGPKGPGTTPISEDAHRMVQTDRHLDPHHKSGDRNMDDKSG